MASVDRTFETNAENAWRLETPGSDGWDRSPRPHADRKYFIVTTDSHLGPPVKLMSERIEAKYRDRLPRMEVKDGKKFMVMEGRRPMLLNEFDATGEDLARAQAGGGVVAMATGGGSTVLQRTLDQQMDGVDGEVIFPNGAAILMFSNSDVEFAQAQARIWNDWAWEVCEPFKQRCNPAAAIATADVESAVAEVQRVAKMGYRVVTLPCKPIFGPPSADDINYNLPVFDPLWAAIQDANLAATFHVSTGQDPRIARGHGGAIINLAVHSLAPTIEPLVCLCASGVLERFPKLRFALIESNGGWLPWLLDTMDQTYRKHHMWMSPYLKMLPSDYFKRQGAVSVCDDPSALLLAEPYRIQDNLMFANDYPHHEGSWPHSAQSIERTMGGLSEDSRKKILGLNAARIFRFDVPDSFGY